MDGMKRLSDVIAAPLKVWLLVPAMFLIMVSCGGSGDSADPVVLTPHLDFIRNLSPTDGSFTAVVWLSDQNGSTVSFSGTPVITSSRGTVSALAERGDRKQEATVTPDADKTGEYVVTLSATVSGSNATVTHTAIVLEQVADGWGQPYSVDGLVNTGGTQDSLAVSPDGQYLFLQYYPVTLSCILAHIITPGDPNDPNDLYCQTQRGPVTAPERPNMPGAERVISASSIHHGCPALGFDPAPFPVPPISMYGFHRQADGSYAEPFVFMFTNNDGCFAPWGPSIKSNADGTYRMFMAFNDPRDSGTASDFAHLYDYNLTPGSTQVLGNTSYSGGVLIDNFVLNKASVAGTDGHRGNPHVYYSGSTPSLLFYDDETQASANQYIHVASWNGTSWNAPVVLDFPPFNTTDYGDTQPYFDGSQLILRNGTRLLSYAYNGGGVSWAASWGAPVTLLESDASALPGKVIVVGEPTIATIDGVEVLFFIYGIQQADGSVNLRAGQVRKE